MSQDHMKVVDGLLSPLFSSPLKKSFMETFCRISPWKGYFVLPSAFIFWGTYHTRRDTVHEGTVGPVLAGKGGQDQNPSARQTRVSFWQHCSGFLEKRKVNERWGRRFRKAQGVSFPSHLPFFSQLFWYLPNQGQDLHISQIQGGGRSVRLRPELQDRCERWASFPCCSRDFFCTTLHARALPPPPLGQEMQQWGALEAGAGIHVLGEDGLSPPLWGVPRWQAAGCSTCALITLETRVSRKPGPASWRPWTCPW